MFGASKGTRSPSISWSFSWLRVDFRVHPQLLPFTPPCASNQGCCSFETDIRVHYLIIFVLACKPSSNFISAQRKIFFQDWTQAVLENGFAASSLPFSHRWQRKLTPTQRSKGRFELLLMTNHGFVGKLRFWRGLDQRKQQESNIGRVYKCTQFWKTRSGLRWRAGPCACVIVVWER